MYKLIPCSVKDYIEVHFMGVSNYCACMGKETCMYTIMAR